jgi:branched-chain amino acid transport system substrate-binding protein
MWHKGEGTVTAGLLLAALAVAGCHTSPSIVAIGFAFTYDIRGAIEVANEEIALHRQSRGPEVSIIADSAVVGDPADVEIKRAERLAARPNMVGVVGHSGSRASLAAAPVYNDAGIVQITPNSTSRLLANAGPWTFNLAPDDSVEGAFIGDFVAGRLQAGRATIYYENDEYGTGLRDGVVATLEQHGVQVVDRVSVDRTSDFRTLVAASLKRGVPDVVVVAGRLQETGTVARLMREHGFPRAVVGGDGALVLPELPAYAGPAADSIYVVAFWLSDAPDLLSRAFVQRFRRVTGQTPESADAMSHDALLLLADAIRRVGPRPEAVRRYLNALGKSEPAYVGVTGPITFQRDARPRLLMARLSGGVLRRVQDP